MPEPGPVFPRLSPRQDVVFKLLFLRHHDLLVDMLEAVLPELDQLHSVFELRERQTGALYSEHMELHVLQLAKLPFARQDEAQLQRWARFLAAQSDAEYAALAR